MARQVGEIKISETIGGICFYKMDGKYYARQKSSLTGRRFWKEEAFAKSRRSCERLAGGSRIASKVYARIDKHSRNYRMFCALKSKAIEILKKGESAEEAVRKLKLFASENDKANKKRIKNGRTVTLGKGLKLKPSRTITIVYTLHEHKVYKRIKNISPYEECHLTTLVLSSNSFAHMTQWSGCQKIFCSQDATEVSFENLKSRVIPSSNSSPGLQ